jgi:hypothetical protein
MAMQAQERLVPHWNAAIAERAREVGRQPADLAEALDWAGSPQPQDGARFGWDGRALDLRRPEPVQPPWDPRPR